MSIQSIIDQNTLVDLWNNFNRVKLGFDAEQSSPEELRIQIDALRASPLFATVASQDELALVELYVSKLPEPVELSPTIGQ